MLAFHKMHGLGNHFVFFDETGQDFGRYKKTDFIRTLCNPKFGLGADGIIFVMDPKDSRHHCRMQYFNSDGSEAELCGNALRGVAHLFRQHNKGYAEILIETLAGVRKASFEKASDGAAFYRVEMGAASFDLVAGGELVAENARKKLEWREETISPVYVNVGNPHAVIFNNEPRSQDAMISIGAWLESHQNHPRRMNVEFVDVLGPHEVRVNVWERGCGLTSACGTGATAVVAAGIKTGRLKGEVTVHMPGGDLGISSANDGELFMTGPVQEVAVGILAPGYICNMQLK